LISWGPPGLFLMAVVDSAGIPLPGGVDALLVAVAAVSPAQAYVSAAWATAGSLVGCLLLFYLARKGGERYLDRHAQGAKAQRLRLWFQHYGLATVFVPALLPIPPLPTKLFVISAGALGVRTAPFVLVVLAARLPRYFGLAYLGARLGEDSWPWLRSHAWHVAAAAAALCLLILLMIRAGASSFSSRPRHARPPSEPRR
jgi:undecaprenyl-diphosphatase